MNGQRNYIFLCAAYIITEHLKNTEWYLNSTGRSWISELQEDSSIVDKFFFNVLAKKFSRTLDHFQYVSHIILVLHENCGHLWRNYFTFSFFPNSFCLNNWRTQIYFISITSIKRKVFLFYEIVFFLPYIFSNWQK